MHTSYQAQSQRSHSPAPWVPLPTIMLLHPKARLSQKPSFSLRLSRTWPVRPQAVRLKVQQKHKYWYWSSTEDAGPYEYKPNQVGNVERSKIPKLPEQPHPSNQDPQESSKISQISLGSIPGKISSSICGGGGGGTSVLALAPEELTGGTGGTGSGGGGGKRPPSLSPAKPSKIRACLKAQAGAFLDISVRVIESRSC